MAARVCFATPVWLWVDRARIFNYTHMSMEPLLETLRLVAGREVRLDDTLAGLGLASSLRQAMLRAALTRRHGGAPERLEPDLRVAELARRLVGAKNEAASGGAERQTKTGWTGGGGGLWGARPFRAGQPGVALVGHGVDLEELADFPAWPADSAEQRAFFELHFTEAELRSASVHPEPQAHLCGLWCAKEAVRKAVPNAASADWRAIEIQAEADGAPRVTCAVTPGVRYALSISHSSRQAMASVVAFSGDRA